MLADERDWFGWGAGQWKRMMAAAVIGRTGPALEAQVLITPPPTLQAWDYFFTVRTGDGYKDNVTLSHLFPEASSFLDGDCRELHLEKGWGRVLKFCAQYEREEVFSNLPQERFAANTVSGGLLWEF